MRINLSCGADRRAVWPSPWEMTLQTIACDAMGQFKARKKPAKSGSALSGKVANAYAAGNDWE